MTKAEIRELFIGPMFDFSRLEVKLAEEMEELRVQNLNLLMDIVDKSIVVIAEEFAREFAWKTARNIQSEINYRRRAGV